MNKKYILTKIMAFIEVLAVFIIFILFYLTREIDTKRVVYIPKGNTNYTIKTLQNSGEDICQFDRFFILLIGYPQAGWVDLKTNKMSKLDFLYRLTHNKAALENIIIIPGETDYFIYKQIEKKLKIRNFYCNIDEGFLKPDTYKLPIGMRREDVCKYLYDKSLVWHKNLAQKIFGVWNYKNYKKYLIVASIVQKEAANKNEMKYISAVVWNRLRKHMKLEMDGTLNYGKNSHIKITPDMIRHNKSFYNTYLYYGLPKNPVCSVSKNAIIAAIFPAKVKYLYFVKCGRHTVFSFSYKSHLKNIKRCKKKSI